MIQIVIIGGGPAGIMTAASILENAKNQDFEIHLFEGNKKLWQKLLISGGGRCNITTGIFEKKILREKYTRGFDFFEHSLGEFSPKKCKKWFEHHNLPLKIEDDFRIFPASNNGKDVLAVFEQIFQKYPKNMFLHFEKKIENIEKNGEKFIGKISEKTLFEADFLIISTGGNAYRKTGSTGDGYHFAKNLWHTITTLWPSLSSFLVAENWPKELSGMSLANAKIFFEKKSIQWSLLFTHFGLSWPLAFMLSSHLAWEKNIRNFPIKIAPLDDFSEKNWDDFLKQNFTLFPKRKIFAILSEKIPKKMAEILVQNYFAHIAKKMVGEIAKKDRENIAKILGNGIPITILDRRPWDEFVTAWGVETSEIDEKTLESKICNNLFFAGEILNIDGYTGGFSLQICWSTGQCIGKSIVQKMEHS